MKTNITPSVQIQSLLDRASGVNGEGGNPRLKAIMRDLLEALFTTVERHNMTEDELWAGVSYLGKAAPELGLIVPGLGIEHFMDLVLDARDNAAGIAAGTPRTIEGPLYVVGAPLSEGSAIMSDAEDDGEVLTLSGVVRDGSGVPVGGAIVDIWHANTIGFYSHFDPTESQSPFNNRRRIRTGSDGRYSARCIMPSGYSVPPGGSTDGLMTALGRHGSRPAHLHYFVDASGFRHLTTQINIADDPLVNDDFAFGTRDGLIPPVSRGPNGASIDFDLCLVPTNTAIDGSMSGRARMEA